MADPRIQIGAHVFALVRHVSSCDAHAKRRFGKFCKTTKINGTYTVLDEVYFPSIDEQMPTF